MFDIGFSELFLIAIVALVVLGPERLPKAARFAGLWVRRARGQWASVKSELERELAADEFKKTLHDTEAAMRTIDADMRAADSEARQAFDHMRDGLDGPSTRAPPQASLAAAAASAGGHDDGADHPVEDDLFDTPMTGRPLPSPAQARAMRSAMLAKVDDNIHAAFARGHDAPAVAASHTDVSAAAASDVNASDPHAPDATHDHDDARPT